jgi:hypothetical protein
VRACCARACSFYSFSFYQLILALAHHAPHPMIEVNLQSCDEEAVCTPTGQVTYNLSGLRTSACVAHLFFRPIASPPKEVCNRVVFQFLHTISVRRSFPNPIYESRIRFFPITLTSMHKASPLTYLTMFGRYATASPTLTMRPFGRSIPPSSFPDQLCWCRVESCRPCLVRTFLTSRAGLGLLSSADLFTKAVDVRWLLA